MTTTTFGAAYAGIYDALYAEKDYDRECDIVEDAFLAHSHAAVRTILDLGCGTGNHALRLAARGYRVTGVDLAPEMLRIAREKAAAESLRIRFAEGNVRNISAGGQYDAALLMFAVLGYQHTNSDVVATFTNIRRHLRPGALLIFDAWYGPGVLADPPGSRSRTIETADGPVEREASSEIDTRRHLCAVHYRLRRPGGGLIGEETHVVRYFFATELETYLQASGFDVVRMAAFDAPEREPDGSDWNALVIARAA